jgi:hypothetical protein
MGFSLYGNGSQAVETQSRIAGTEIEARFQHLLHPQIEIRLAGSVQLETGAARLRWAEDFRPKQIQRLKEAQVRWTPWDAITLVAGAVDQLHWRSPLLLQRQSFPALYEKGELRASGFYLRVEAQQAVPADTSSLQPWGNWPSGMPGFYFERATAGYELPDTVEIAAHLSHFLFENLSGPSAYQAQFLGNTVNGVGAATAYAFGFQGYEGALQAKGRIGHFYPGMEASFLNNLAAPIDKARGWRLSTQVGWEVRGGIRFTPQWEWFEVASDAAPSFYNDRVFGHGNRRGMGLQLAALWSHSGIEAAARWVRSRPVSPNPYQSDMDWVQLSLSTDYEIF